MSIHDYWKNHSFNYTDLFTSIVTLIIAKIKQGFPGDSDGKQSACDMGDQFQSQSQKDLVENGRATHSNVLAWRITWTEDPGGLCPWGHKESDTTE